MPKINYRHAEYRLMEKKWALIADCIDGQDAVKGKTTVYLPKPNASDTSQQNTDRYTAYVARAVFYPVTARTLRGLVGQVTQKEPVVEIPSTLQDLEEDADGSGISLPLLAQASLRDATSFGRSGLYVDYPTTSGLVSIAEQEAFNIRPTIGRYHPLAIINWRVEKIGAESMLVLVVLEETYVTSDDGFEEQVKDQWRALRIYSPEEVADQAIRNGFAPTAYVNGPLVAPTGRIYTVETWVRNEGADAKQEEFILKDRVFPRDNSGSLMDTIPFYFIGSDNNNTTVDEPPLYDIATINIAHYRNSADYEDACYMVGQPTPWFSGLTQQWVDDVMKGQVFLGSRGSVLLPENGAAGLMQVAPNTMTKEAMDQKERQMTALGAKLVEQRDVQRTATEAGQEEAAETSVLSTISKNVSAAYENALKAAQRFVSSTGDDAIEFELPTDFTISTMTPQEQQQCVASWMSGAITFEEMRAQLRAAGKAHLDDEEAKDQLENEMSQGIGAGTSSLDQPSEDVQSDKVVTNNG